MQPKGIFSAGQACGRQRCQPPQKAGGSEKLSEQNGGCRRGGRFDSLPPDSPPPGSMRDGGAAAASRRYLHARLAPLERRVEQLRGHRLALVRPTQLAQDLSVPSPQIHLRFLAGLTLFWYLCGLFYHTRRHEPHAPVRSLVSLSALLYGQYTSCVHAARSVHAQPALRLRELGLDARLRGAELRRRRLRELGRRPPGSF